MPITDRKFAMFLPRPRRFARLAKTQPKAEAPMISTLQRNFDSIAAPRGPLPWLYGFIALHFVLVGAAQAYTNTANNNAISTLLIGMLVVFIPAYALMIITAKCVQMLRAGEKTAPSKVIRTQFRNYLADRHAVVQSLTILVFFIIFFDSFTRLKAMIPALNPFGWDIWMAQLDRALHGGIDPWVWLHPITQHGFVIKTLDLAYAGWAIVLYMAIFHAIFARTNTRNRYTFLISFVLVWAIGGNGLAVMFSSAGPVYFADLGLGGTFDALNAHLAQMNETTALGSAIAKELLWDGFEQGGSISGISAFPSMHVGSTALIALFAFGYSRRAGWIMVGFMTMIMIGSVSLAWHYAVDGYASMLLALASWRFAQWLTARSALASD
jgi:hypothetical protein